MREREWDGRCHRCAKKTGGYIMSMFSTALICFNCKDKETGRDDYKKAVDAEDAAIRAGNYNYKGIEGDNS